MQWLIGWSLNKAYQCLIVMLSTWVNCNWKINLKKKLQWVFWWIHLSLTFWLLGRAPEVWLLGQRVCTFLQATDTYLQNAFQKVWNNLHFHQQLISTSPSFCPNSQHSHFLKLLLILSVKMVCHCGLLLWF